MIEIDGYEFPDVDERPVIVDGKTAKGYKAIVNPTRGYVYSIVSNRYGLVRHEEVYELYKRAIETNNLEPLEEIVRFTGNLSETMYIVAIFSEVKIGRDTLRYGVAIRNSYDGSSSLYVLGKATVNTCLNDMFLPKGVVGEYFIHNRKLLEDGLKEVSKAIVSVVGSVNMFNRFVNKLYDREVTAKFIRYLIDVLNISKRIKERLMVRFMINYGIDFEADDKKLNEIKVDAWNALNEFTREITHTGRMNYDIRVRLNKRVINAFNKAISEAEAVA